MKKLLFLFGILYLTSCSVEGDSGKPQSAGLGDFELIVIDSCEYLTYDNGIGNHRVFAITHKGNCKNHIK